MSFGCTRATYYIITYRRRGFYISTFRGAAAIAEVKSAEKHFVRAPTQARRWSRRRDPWRMPARRTKHPSIHGKGLSSEGPCPRERQSATGSSADVRTMPWPQTVHRRSPSSSAPRDRRACPRAHFATLPAPLRASNAPDDGKKFESEYFVPVDFEDARLEESVHEYG